MKDVARVHRVPHGTVNYITAMLDDGTDWTGLFRQAAGNRKLKDFIRTYPEVVEEVRLLLGQPRAASVHASAIIVTPETLVWYVAGNLIAFIVPIVLIFAYNKARGEPTTDEEGAGAGFDVSF